MLHPATLTGSNTPVCAGQLRHVSEQPPKNGSKHQSLPRLAATALKPGPFMQQAVTLMVSWCQPPCDCHTPVEGGHAYTQKTVWRVVFRD